jgi:hypothetical protein
MVIDQGEPPEILMRENRPRPLASNIPDNGPSLASIGSQGSGYGWDPGIFQRFVL